ncbi:MAG: phosphoribosylamine--glycine ligase [Thermodesulfobacteriota bacterium]
MKVLVIGSGGREHALAWKISQSKRVKKVFCAPGNAGTAKCAENVGLGSDDIEGLLAFALKKKVDLTVVGPEAPLVAGIVDLFQQNGLAVFGPTKFAARLEGEKSFAKAIMEKYGIPTAKARTFTDPDKAEAWVRKQDGKLVVKADGLAAGKGVLLCENPKQALDAVSAVMRQKEFGAAGDTCVIEEFLEGEEASFLAFTDGKTVLPLPCSQDHKAVFDNDQGPNTGGMGAYSPAPVVTPWLFDKVMDTVMKPMVRAMAAEGHPYKGILYAGLMIKGESVKVLEFNARFGDPECQPLLMRLETDLVDVLEAGVNGTLSTISLSVDPRPCVCVVMASQGYPGSYPKGKEITGLSAAAKLKDVMVFHAGTKLSDSKVLSSGGRVLGVTAVGSDLPQAIARAYEAVGKIKFDGAFCRSDIGKKALDRPALPPQVLIVMGSDSDLPVMDEAGRVLRKLHIVSETTVCSAHRTPDRAAAMAKEAAARGIKVIIAGAGAAAHLAGVLAAHTTLPVIGVPISATSLNGMDALLATVQMPPGVPVATMAVGKSGAHNAAILAAQIIALANPETAALLAREKQNLAASVEKKAEALAKRFP